jgi:nucleoid-associated protein
VYSHYESHGRNYLAIFIVRDAEKVIFKHDPIRKIFVVNTTTIIDTDKLSMACRIDLDKLQNKEDRYLQFTNYKQQEISDYFVNWLEASQVSKIAEDTKSFLKIIDNIDIPIDPDTDEEYEEDKFRSNLHRMVISAGGILRVKEISAQFWDDENHLFEYIEENDININGEFRVSKTIFNRLNKFEVTTGKIKLSFSKGEWKNGTVRKGDKNQIVIESSILRAKIDALINGTND